MRGEVKGNFVTWPALRRVIPKSTAWRRPGLRPLSGRDPAAWPFLVWGPHQAPQQRAAS